MRPMQIFSLSRTVQRFANGAEGGRALKNRDSVRHVVTLALLAIVIAAVSALTLSVVRSATPYGWASTTSDVSPVRSGAAVAQDGTVSPSQVLLFGGKASSGLVNDTWRWNSTAWTKLNPSTSPTARSGATLVYDPAHRQDVLFGGTGSKGALADTWRWNGTTWTQLTMTTSPSARSGAGAAFDPITNQIVLFGGLGSAENNDTWTFGATTWTKLTSAQAPSARDSFGFATGGDGSLVLVDGKSGSTAVSGTWVWQTMPGAPQSVTATAQNRQATVSWSALLSGGSPITSYTVTASPGGVIATSTSTSVTVTGLQVATTYTCTVTATNALGTGAASAASNSTTTWTYASAPQNVTATAGNAQATVSWQTPSSDGGSAITGYTVTPYIGATAQPATNVSGTTLSTTISGLTNGTTYTFAVAATTVVGTGPAATSPTVTPVTVPSAPQNVSAVAGNAQATVSWQAPSSTGGSPITGYVVTTFIGTAQQSKTTVDAATNSTTITGLTNGTTYSFSVVATNAAGTGPSSSTSATPSNLPSAPLNVSATASGSDRVTVSWQTPASEGGSPIISYMVTPYQGTTALAPVTTTTSPVTVTGLISSSTYTFSVAATNTNGTGAAATSSPVTTAITACPVAGAT